MKKTFLTVTACLVILVQLLCFTSCRKQEPVSQPDSAIETEESSGTLAMSTEGNPDYERAYQPKIYQINGDLDRYITQNCDVDLEAWFEAECDKIKEAKYGIADPSIKPMLLAAIEEFQVPRAEFERINQEYIDFYENQEGMESMIPQVCYTAEEIDALYSNDPAELARVFATEYAIVCDDTAYAPKFYLEATEAELSTCGITAPMITAKNDLLVSNSVVTE